MRVRGLATRPKRCVALLGFALRCVALRCEAAAVVLPRVGGGKQDTLAQREIRMRVNEAGLEPVKTSTT